MNENIQSKLYNGYTFRFGQYLSEGFGLFKKGLPLFLGFAALVAVISTVLPIFPLLGGFISTFFLLPALSAGFYIAADKLSHNETLRFTHFFDGFKQMKPLALINLTIVFFFLFSFLTAVYFMIETSSMLGLYSELSNLENKFKNFQDLPWGQIVTLFIFLLLIPTFVYALYLLSVPFLLFEKSDFWSAMMASRTLSFKKLGFTMLITLSSAAIFYGIYFGLFYGALAKMYQDIIVETPTLGATEEGLPSMLWTSILKKISQMLVYQMIAMILAYTLVPLFYCVMYAFYKDIASENDVEKEDVA